MIRFAHDTGTVRRGGFTRAALVLTMAAAGVAWFGVRPAEADLARVREKAVELEQKLNRHRFDVEVKGDKANYERIYKDFDFLLKKSKLDEAAEEAATDPHADRFRMYLVRSIVAKELASYTDELNNQLGSKTSDMDDAQLTYSELVVRLANAGDEVARRKIVTSLKPLLETANVFRNQIATRTVENYRAWGFDDYASFYAQWEGLDLDALAAEATEFLGSSQELYDRLLAEIAPAILGVEPRKVRYSDLPYLLEGSAHAAAFPPDGRVARVNGIFSGLGVELPSVQGLTLDTKTRPGRRVGGGVYPFVVPTEVMAGFLPTEGPPDDDMAIMIRAEALFYALSKETAFETAYLGRHAPQVAVGYLVRGVRDEKSWIEANLQLADAGAYLRYRAYARVLEARMLAAGLLYELAIYRGQPDAESAFKDQMQAATGIRLSSTDTARALEWANNLDSAAHLRGLFWSARLTEHLRASLGEDWYAGGKAASTLTGWWAAGGALTGETLAASTGDLTGGGGALVRNIEAQLP